MSLELPWSIYVCLNSAEGTRRKAWRAELTLPGGVPLCSMRSVSAAGAMRRALAYKSTMERIIQTHLNERGARRLAVWKKLRGQHAC